MRRNLGGIDKRKIARVLAVLAVALAAGHLVQTMAARKAQPQTAQTQDVAKPKAVVQLAASNDAVVPPRVAKPLLPTPALTPPSAQNLPAAMTVMPALPTLSPPNLTAPAVVADPCPVTMDLMADPGAMIGVTLLAPCHPSERIVLRHAGLAVTVMTTATGSVFLALPALETDAMVEAKFADGSGVSSNMTVADVAKVRRFGVQWQGDDAFQVYGVEPAGTVSATNRGVAPAVDLPLSGGFLTRLGDASAATPLLAEIYTYPGNSRADVVVEAAVTPTTCGREILGETLSSVAGSVTVTDLSLAMPECDAVGDFLVLNNLASDLTLAAAN